MTSAAHPRYLRRQPREGHLRFHARRLCHCFWPLRHHRTVVLSGQSTARQTDAARYCYLRLPATARALSVVVAQRPELIGGAWSSSSLPGYAALTSTHSQPVIHRVSQPSGAFHPLQTFKSQTPSISCHWLRDRHSRSSPRCCKRAETPAWAQQLRDVHPPHPFLPTF